jgi:hypothetical protein
MIVERVRHSGAIVISDIIGGYRVEESYYGYTQAQAIRLFKERARDE